MENLGLDTKLLIAQIVNFGIFFFVFQRFIAKPFLAYLHKQKEEDNQRIKMADDLEKRQAMMAEKDKELAQERKKILHEALEQSKKNAEIIKQEILDGAKKEAEDLIKKTQIQLVEERERLYKDIRKQIVGVSMLAVEKGLKDYLTSDAQATITRNLIKHIPEDVNLEAN
ncbi:hypothetical protein BH09PAT2_BH09PAT2_11140 [soil metagenome]